MTCGMHIETKKMGVSITRQWVFFLLCMILVNNALAYTPINEGVLDPCKRPNQPAGCHSDPNAPRQEANQWSRGCSSITRCRGR